MKSEFHFKSFPKFMDKLLNLIMIQLLIMSISFIYFQDYLGSFYLLLGFFFVMSFSKFFQNFNKDFTDISFYILIITIVYFSFPVLVYVRYSFVNICWLLLIPIGTYLFYKIEVVLKITIGIFLYLCLLVFVQTKVNILENQNLNQTHLYYGGIIIKVCVLFNLIFFLIEHFKIQKKYKIYLEEQNAKIEERQSQRFRLENEKLLNEITSYIVDNKLYTQYDLTIKTLCKSIGKSYFEVSKILKNNNIPSYKTYINSIRIQKIVDKINKGALDSYTIQTLYQENGFEHQSTFNRVFKEIMGETPSDFIKKNAP